MYRLITEYPFKYDTLNPTLKTIEPLLLKKSNSIDIKDPNPDGVIKISGDYITLFEDEDNGRIVIRKALATLKTFGNRVTGITSFGSSYSWKIKGRIHKKKRITGLYYARSVLDDGFGTFFLEVKSPSVLEGYWCGYDNANGKVFSGKYIFKKIYMDYTVRNIKSRIIRESYIFQKCVWVKIMLQATCLKKHYQVMSVFV